MVGVVTHVPLRRKFRCNLRTYCEHLRQSANVSGSHLHLGGGVSASLFRREAFLASTAAVFAETTTRRASVPIQQKGGDLYGHVSSGQSSPRLQTGFPSPVVVLLCPGSKMSTTKQTIAASKPSVENELRASCDRCWSKKRRCPGGNPCLRCRRGSFVCHYSRKRKLGRPAGSGSKSDSKRKQPPTATRRKQQQRYCQQPKQERKEQQGGQQEEKQQQHQEVSTSAAGGRYEPDGGMITALKNPSFVCSSATGLAGLPESRFLSCFLEHYAPM